MRYLRIWGIAVFAVLVAVVAAVWFLFIDHFVERAVEKAGTALVGAEVDLAGADLTLSPMGLTLTGLQVTNPDRPETNAVEAARIAFDLDGGQLVRRRVIIDDMAVEGVRLNTERASPGRVLRREKKRAEPGMAKKLAERFALPELKIPEPSEVLSREKLESIDKIREMKSDLEEVKAEWKARVDRVADKDKIEEFKRRAEKIQESAEGGALGALGGAGEAASLKKDIEEYLGEVQSVRKDLTGDIEEWRGKVKEATELPLKEARRLAEKYSPSLEGLGNMTGLLFGPRMAGMVESATRWYERLDPLVRRAAESRAGVRVEKPLRAEGVDVHFTETNPRPEFMIKRAAVSADLPLGEVAGTLKNITGEQGVSGVPATFDFSGRKLKGLDSLSVKGALDRVNPATPLDKITASIRGYGLKDVKLTESEALPVSLRRALADISVDATLAGGTDGGRKIDSTVKAAFASVDLAADGEGRIASIAARTLTQVKSFNLEADVTGTLDDYDVGLSSGLDSLVKDAVGGLVKEETKKLTEGLTASIKEKAGGQLDDLTGELDSLEGLTGVLGSHSEKVKGILAEAVPGKRKLPGGIKLPF